MDAELNKSASKTAIRLYSISVKSLRLKPINANDLAISNCYECKKINVIIYFTWWLENNAGLSTLLTEHQLL